MNGLITTVNDLQDAFASLDSKFVLDLPQIAVVGSQSAGKSSVLENIVGKDFLPRGTGIVTRRPLILQLIRNSSDDGEYGEFLHLNRQKKFYDFNEIRDEIQRETDRVCGENKGVSWSPINLRIHSPNVLDLTLIDLPGMTKVPVGDQPADIECQIRNLIYQYVQNPNCLVLAVNPANSDLANSDALKLAQEVDPSGSRTIGVLTKLDLMDEGTDARSVLLNEVIPLKYGYIGVVNRSQRDIDTSKHIEAALEAERRFFLGQPAYRDIADQQGTAYLQKALNYHLVRHISETLPGLKAKLQKRSDEIERELGDFATDINYDDANWKTKTMLMNLLNFSDTYRMQLLGQTDVGINLGELSSGAKIEHFFHVKYPSMLKTIEFTDEALMKKQIGFAILNNIGPRVALFTPDKAFDQIVRTQVEKLKDPTMELLDMTAAEILKVLDKALEATINFPRLTKAIESRANVYIMEQVESTRNKIQEFIDCENAYINAKHEDFVGFSCAEYVASRRVLARRNPATETIKSGYLNITNLSLLRDKRFWFVLTPETLSWFTDETRQECKFIIAFDDFFMVNDTQRPFKFILYHTKNKIIYKELNRLEFNASSQDDLDSWKRSFARVGIFGDSISPSDPTMYALFSGSVSKEILDTNDPNLERQIETIWVLVESYMQIVLSTLKRMVPKIVTFALIKDTVHYLEKKFVAEFPKTVDLDEVMEENEIQKERRLRLAKTLQACKIALEKLSNVNLPRTDIKVYSDKPGKRITTDAVVQPQRPARPAKAAAAAAASRAPLVGQQSLDSAAPATTSAVFNAPKAEDIAPVISSAPAKKKSSIFSRNSLYGSSNRNLDTQMEKARQQIDSNEKSMFYVM